MKARPKIRRSASTTTRSARKRKAEKSRGLKKTIVKASRQRLRDVLAAGVNVGEYRGLVFPAGEAVKKIRVLPLGAVEAPAEYQPIFLPCHTADDKGSLSVTLRTDRSVVEGVVLKRRFSSLAKQWETETLHTSSTDRVIRHSAFQQIIAMGPAAIPLIVDRLRSGRTDWSWALAAITKEDPVPADAAGDMPLVRKRWLELAERKGWSGG